MAWVVFIAWGLCLSISIFLVIAGIVADPKIPDNKETMFFTGLWLFYFFVEHLLGFKLTVCICLVFVAIYVLVENFVY